MTSQYRPEVDGLRAVAVIPVILFHAGFSWFSGGYVGVDIFFVISGYLITGIIYKELREGRFSIVTFYERRARRILPALFFISLACLMVAWFWLLPEEFEKLSESLVAVNFFVSNIYFWQDMDYFAGPAEMKPFLHTWSLAVEEQFYLLFPLFMILFGRFREGILLSIIVLGFLASLALAEWGATSHPAANFYLLPTRAWELMAGAIIAIYMQGRTFAPPPLLSNVAAATGLALILYAIIFFDERIPFPGLWALIPVLGTSLVILFAKRENFLGRLLSLKPIVGIGLISYSAYLWHQPVFVFARERSLEPVSEATFLMLGVLSLLLAWFSWRYVELPFRNRRNFTRPQIFTTALAVSCLMIGFGVYGSYSRGIPWRLNDEVQRYVEIRKNKDINSEGCQSTPGNMLPIEKACAYNGYHDSQVVVWGDSQATPLIAPVTERISSSAMSVRQFVYTNCLPIAGYTRSDDTDCGKFNNEAMQYVIDNDGVELVIMLGRYPLQFEGETFDNGEGGVEIDSIVHAVPLSQARKGVFGVREDRLDAVGELLRDTVKTLVDHDKRVVVIYPVPEVGWNVPYRLAKEAMYGIERNGPISTSLSLFHQRTSSSYEQLDKIEEHENLLKIEPAKLFCDTYLPDRCTTEMNDNILYYDNNHLSEYGAGVLVQHIFDEMEERGWLRGEVIEVGLAEE